MSAVEFRAPMSLRERLTASEAARVSLATELATTRRTLYLERARRQHHIPDELVEFVTATDEADILAQVATLAAHITRRQETR